MKRVIIACFLATFLTGCQTINVSLTPIEIKSAVETGYLYAKLEQENYTASKEDLKDLQEYLDLNLALWSALNTYFNGE